VSCKKFNAAKTQCNQAKCSAISKTS
jgi:hypothetical protein